MVLYFGTYSQSRYLNHITEHSLFYYWTGELLSGKDKIPFTVEFIPQAGGLLVSFYRTHAMTWIPKVAVDVAYLCTVGIIQLIQTFKGILVEMILTFVQKMLGLRTV